MKHTIIALALALAPVAAPLSASALPTATPSQPTPDGDDPVVMTVNGQAVPRSEFEYSYNKNNTEGVIDKKTVEEYVDLFINYKLKYFAAKDAQLDTLTSFKTEFADYRNQQVRPALVTDADVLAEARRVYDAEAARIGSAGLIRPAHIFLRLAQQAPQSEVDAAKVRIDSIYQALRAGADFAELAKSLSQDPGSAPAGGTLPWIAPGQAFPEFEKAAYALQTGQMSAPVQSPAGWHIILMQERKQLEPFDFFKDNIVRSLEQQGVREHLAERRLDTLVAATNGALTKEQMLEVKADELSAQDLELRYLIREFYEGLLVVEISKRNVWDLGASDEAGLAAYFKANKRKYDWDQPRFKGIAYHVKDRADVAAVKKCVKKLPFDQWNEALRRTFNADSVLRIRVERGLFRQGDNALVDREVFRRDTTVAALPDYPIDAVYGKLLKKGPEDFTDVRSQVTADYQELLEQRWVAELRQRYTFTVNKDVLETVNKHQ